MTFRTFDIDAGHIASTATDVALTSDVTAPVRHLRNRRRALALSGRSGGPRIVGFGI